VTRVVNRRIRLLLALLALAFAGMLVRAIWIQGVRAASLARMATVQHRQTVELPAARGTIYDRTGVQLAIGEQATTVYADPREVRNPRAVAGAASRLVGADPNELLAALADRDRAFVYVQRKADSEKASALARRGLVGLGFYPEERRSYPQRGVGAHVLGYAGVDNTGLAGLELELDSELSGEAGSRTIVRDPFGRAIDVVDERPAQEGRDVYLTLDHTLQANAEEVLRRTLGHWNARAASAVVLDPRTGAILAMAVVPGFDANRFGAVPRSLQRNRAVEDTYEPGSTFKLVTATAVLSEGLVSPSTAYTLQPSIHVADRIIHEAHERGTERMTVAEIVSRSSNVGTITLAQMLGRDRLLRWIKRFGFGRRTGIDFPGESAGLLPTYWSGSTIGTLPIGHGIAVTPVQMAAAYASVANRGVWNQPHLLDHVEGRRPHRYERRRVVSRTVAAQINAMLQNVVVEGTGTLAAVPGYKVAGKTGTAAKPDPRGGYSDSRYVASFVGYVPASDPRLVILVTVDEPQGAIWGGVVAAPAFAEIARFGLQYLEVPPDAPERVGEPETS
jgi:cell division protein FtsI (penicillin-binding protein 3)